MKTQLKGTSARLILGALLLGPSAAISADQAPDGKALHDARCLACHGTEVYTRENHKIRSLQALGTQVRRCTQLTGVKWFDDETDAVIDYLNQNFYKFEGTS
jgi:mono/diheme cytochrome c family protein